MYRFWSIVLGADVVSVLAVAFFFSATSAQAKQCSTERPPNARSYWSYRLIDGRKCWYEGKPLLSKSLLHWPAAGSAQANLRRESDVLPANHYNLLDSQASIANNSEAKRKPEVEPEIVESNPVRGPTRTLTPDNLRSWANSMAAMTAEPIMTILDRWPDEELPQHRTKPTPVGQSSSISARTIISVTIMFTALLAMLMTTFMKVTAARRDGGSLLLGR
jgi:hypothetical protein